MRQILGLEDCGCLIFSLAGCEEQYEVGGQPFVARKVLVSDVEWSVMCSDVVEEVAVDGVALIAREVVESEACFLCAGVCYVSVLARPWHIGSSAARHVITAGLDVVVLS